MKDKRDEFTEAEAALRFEAALRGSRKAGHVPMDKLTRKDPKRQEKPAKKPVSGA